jgi:radical SAM enzyme (TIGR01210 family)
MTKNTTVKSLSYRIQSFMKRLRVLSRDLNPNEFSLESPIFTEERKSLLEEGYVKRLVIFLRGTGCTLVELNGGCTFCGFYQATNFGKKITDKQYIHQIHSVLNNKLTNISQYSVISLYNDGSLFSEQEIGFEALREIFRILSAIPTVKRIVIESKIQDLSLKKIEALRKSTSKEIEIAFGFESSDPIIRRLCINKTFNNSKVLKLIEMMDSINILPVGLIMAKPPFLTEDEAIDDIIKSFAFLQNTKIHRIDMELPIIAEKTLTHALWEKGYYQPILLSSIISIMEKIRILGMDKKIYISPSSYSVPSVHSTNTNNDVNNLFESFNSTQDFDLFRNFSITHNVKEIEMKLDSDFGQFPLMERILKLLNILEA